MQSLMNAVAMRTSTAGTRPLPSALGSRRWAMAAFSTAASWMRICFCWCGGKTEMMRLIVSVASIVCRVEQHQMSGLGGVERGLDGFHVAHFAHEDDVRILTHCAAQVRSQTIACRRRFPAD